MRELERFTGSKAEGLIDEGFRVGEHGQECCDGVVSWVQEIEFSEPCMDIVFSLQGVLFEWDGEKAQRNLAHHGVAFEEAAEVFFDPFYQYGNTTPNGVMEQRDFILGYSVSQRLLLVVYTERGERTRIISARPATRAERKLYESA